MGIAPAGTAVENTGHHHLLIDTGLPPLDQPIPADAQHVHFGKGQTETTITLSPGKHTLQLLLGDQNHIPHVPAVFSNVVTITVKRSDEHTSELQSLMRISYAVFCLKKKPTD